MGFWKLFVCFSNGLPIYIQNRRWCLTVRSRIKRYSRNVSERMNSRDGWGSRMSGGSEWQELCHVYQIYVVSFVGLSHLQHCSALYLLILSQMNNWDKPVKVGQLYWPFKKFSNKYSYNFCKMARRVITKTLQFAHTVCCCMQHVSYIAFHFTTIYYHIEFEYQQVSTAHISIDRVSSMFFFWS